MRVCGARFETDKKMDDMLMPQAAAAGTFLNPNPDSNPKPDRKLLQRDWKLALCTRTGLRVWCERVSTDVHLGSAAGVEGKRPRDSAHADAVPDGGPKQHKTTA